MAKEAPRRFFENQTSTQYPPVMAYFDVTKETSLTVDASPVGISAILSQNTKNRDDSKIIAYASHSFTDVERRYSQTEKEALSFVWAIKHFHLFLYGQQFTLITDHKPLEIIYGTTRSKPSARIERWVLRLQPYHFKVQYKPGSENAADYLSRHPSDKMTNKSEQTEEYISYISSNAVPKAMTLQEIAQETYTDKELQQLRAAIRTGTWESISKDYRLIKDELTIGTQNVVLRRTRIVIPR